MSQTRKSGGGVGSGSGSGSGRSGGRRKQLAAEAIPSAFKPLRKQLAAEAIPSAGKPLRKQLAAEAMPSSRKSLRKQRVEKMQIVVKSAHYIPDPWEIPKEERSNDYRYFARLTVEPTLTVAALKSMLKSYQWAMVENLVIVSEDGKVQLEDDNSTLGDYGVKENDTLLVCGEDGPFRFYIYSIMDMQGFPVSVRGCFSNIWDVKQKIFKKMGYKPEVQVLIHCANSARLEDNTLLVALGIVKPYMEDMKSEMKWKVPYLQLVGPVRKRSRK